VAAAVAHLLLGDALFLQLCFICRYVYTTADSCFAAAVLCCAVLCCAVLQVPVGDNYFAALNSAVFSDGSFVYVPKGVKSPMELSTYFRINASETGQVRNAQGRF
jgi:hypothetical protein